MFSHVGICPGEFRDFVIEKPVIHPIGHFALQNFFQLFQIEHHAGGRVGLARHGHFQHVIVPVAVRIVAFAEDAPVLLGRKCRVVIEMRSRKLDFACQINHNLKE